MGGEGDQSLQSLQSSASQGKQMKSAAGLMAKEVLAVDTLKKKLEYEFHFSSTYFFYSCKCSHLLNSL